MAKIIFASIKMISVLMMAICFNTMLNEPHKTKHTLVKPAKKAFLQKKKESPHRYCDELQLSENQHNTISSK